MVVAFMVYVVNTVNCRVECRQIKIQVFIFMLKKKHGQNQVLGVIFWKIGQRRARGFSAQRRFEDDESCQVSA